MSDFVLNIGLARIVELYNRVDNNDPANSAFIVTIWNVSGVEATEEALIKDADTVAAIEALANVAEVTNANYVRKVLTDTELTAFAPDDANDRADVDIPDQTWTAVGAGDGWTDFGFNYDSDTTAGTDANIEPLTSHDFVVIPNGGDITAQINAAGIFRAS